jgi:CO dehydrogenase/acetyl-CoA synthase epsilon subunit
MYYITESDKLYLVNFFTEVTNKALKENQSVDFLVFEGCTKLVWQIRQEIATTHKTICTIEVQVGKKPNILILGRKAMAPEVIEFLKKWSDEVGIPIEMPSYT